VPALHVKRRSSRIKTRPAFLTTWMVVALLATTPLLNAQSACGARRPADHPSITPPAPCPYPGPATALESAATRLNEDSPRNRQFILDRTTVQDRWAYGIARQTDPAGVPLPYRFAVLLALADADGRWCSLAPGVDPPADYNRALASFSASLLDEATVAWLHQLEPDARLDNLTGHRLPWPGSQLAYVMQRDGPYHQNQVDFDILGWGGSGEVVASRPGEVVFVKESSNTGCCDFSCWEQANMVVIQHADEEFSWYVHLAYHSVPITVGQRVEFGTRIGVEGDTGFACGVHLHYMASAGHTAWTDPEDPNEAPWGLDITAVDFDESPWLGLIPGLSYISQNYGPVSWIYLPIMLRHTAASP
jgi:murein DD-endopeptidase MepM/ murein hydrolase activator NlpD